MKHFKNYMACLAMCALLFTSCSKDESSGNMDEKATLSFGAVVNDLASKATNKQSLADLPECSEDAPAYVEIVLMQGETEIVGSLDDPFRVDLVAGQLFTEEVAELELEPGTYSLDHFSVYNADGDLIWLAPKGGVMADFVDYPLPLEINLGAGVKKYVDVSVLCYDDRDVNQYGYLFFELDATRAFEFCFFANYCAPDGRHYPARYSVDISIDGTVIYTDEVNTTDVNSDGDWFAAPLCLALPDIAAYADDEEYIDYTITLLDWDGVYDGPGTVITGSLSRAEVMANFDGEDNVNYEHIRFNCEPGGGDCVPGPGDIDGDCIPDGEDPCPSVPTNTDMDGDCIPDNEDNCPMTPNPGQEDSNDNGIGDACDYPGGNDDCETAFMWGDNSFWALEIGTRWGWAEHVMPSDLPLTAGFYAGAGQNDITKGYKAGDVHVTVEGTTVSVWIDTEDGVTLNETHIYFSDTAAPTVTAPGQYGNTDSDPTDGEVYTFDTTDGDFWLIVHAEVCTDSAEE